MDSPTLPLVVLPQYLASIDVYAASLAAGRIYIDREAKFNKRFKAAHRTAIADANGVINLTVPIEKPERASSSRWSDIVISAHDSWWNIHLTALRSAYGRTPFYEFYDDDFAKFFTSDHAGRRLVDYVADLQRLVWKLIGCVPVVLDKQPAEAVGFDYEVPMPVVEYYQVRAHKFGFTPHLSIVDLLFNMGPESILVLEAMAGL